MSAKGPAESKNMHTVYSGRSQITWFVTSWLQLVRGRLFSKLNQFTDVAMQLLVIGRVRAAIGSIRPTSHVTGSDVTNHAVHDRCSRHSEGQDYGSYLYLCTFYATNITGLNCACVRNSLCHTTAVDVLRSLMALPQFSMITSK